MNAYEQARNYLLTRIPNNQPPRNVSTGPKPLKKVIPAPEPKPTVIRPLLKVIPPPQSSPKVERASKKVIATPLPHPLDERRAKKPLPVPQPLLNVRREKKFAPVPQEQKVVKRPDKRPRSYVWDNFNGWIQIDQVTQEGGGNISQEA